MVVIKGRRPLELGIHKLEDLESDAVSRAQPRRLDLLQAVWVDLDYRRRRRFGALRKPNWAQFTKTQNRCVPFDGGFAVGDRDSDVIDNMVV